MRYFPYKKFEMAVVKEVFEKLSEAPPIPPQAKLNQGTKSSPEGSSPPSPLKLSGDLASDAKMILDANKDKLKNKGINVNNLKQVGVGTQGVAFDMGDKILKVTKDGREAKASSIVAGKNIPNIIQIFDIWKFPGVDWYGLILEKVNPLPEQEARLLTNMNQYLGPINAQEAQAVNLDPKKSVPAGFAGMIGLFGDSVTKAQQALAKILTIRTHGKPNGEAEKQKYMNWYQTLLGQYKLVNLYRSLKSLGIYYYDFHGGNFGKRDDGSLVLFDLGLSRSQGALPAELQENKFIEILESKFGPAKPIQNLS